MNEECNVQEATCFINNSFMDQLEVQAINEDYNPIDGPQVTWKFKDDVDKPDNLSQVSYSTIINARYKFTHEMVLEALTSCESKSDVKLSVMEEMKDDMDVYTPDVLLNLQSLNLKKKLSSSTTWLSMELSTSGSYDYTSLKAVYKDKFDKYSGALIERAIKLNCGLIFIVVVVGWNQVLSSIELPDEIVNDLIIRNRIAHAVKLIYSEQYGVELDSDERAKEREKSRLKIYEQIKSVDFDVEVSEAPYITKAFTKECEKPVDTKKMIRMFSAILKDTHKDLVDEIKNKEENDFNYVSEFIEKHNEGERRNDMKCVINMPGVIPGAKEELTTTVVGKSIIPDKEDHPEVKLWSKAFEEVLTNPAKFEENPELLIQQAQERNPEWLKDVSKDKMNKKKEYHRVNLRGVLNDDELIEVGYDGLWAKARKDNPAIKSKRIESQKFFSWDTDTSDIDEHINNKECLEEQGTLVDVELSLRLLEEANSHADNPPVALECVKEWTKTKLFHHYHYMSLAALEVAIANKQHCQPQYGILKTPLGMDFTMLMIPTNSKEHFFVSFYFPGPVKELFKTTNLKLIEVEGGCVTQFTSFKTSKLENKSTMDNAVITLASHWAYFYSMKDASPSSFMKNDEARRMLLLSLLIRAEDKERTEFVITQTRYMYMECFRGSAGLIRPNPLRLLSKLETNHRSRLSLWVTKNIVRNFVEMSRNPPKRIPIEDAESVDQETPPDDNWKGLINFLTGGSISSAARCINLSYLGYLKNKNETQEGNSDHKITSKIVGPEFKFNRYHPGVYGKESEEDQLHSFDLNSFLHGTDVMKRKLRQKIGSTFKSKIAEDIIDTLAKQTTESIATLKASCSADQEELKDKTAELVKDYRAGRIKVLEALAKEISNVSINPFWNLKKFLEWFETKSLRITVDIFRKPQHGGVREIYVMTIRSRIIQLFLECIGRTICSYFPEETMTHPENKITRLDSHRVASVKHAKTRKCAYTDLGSSMDKSKWNQQIIMTALYAVTSQFLPKSCLPSLQRCLNLFIDRLVILPQSVMNLLISGKVLNDPDFQKLYSHFKYPSEDNVFRRHNAPYITMRTGMMQGVLHYLSSLMHLCLLNSCEVLIPSLIKTICPDCDVKFTQVCSSDDSSCVLSIFSPINTSANDSSYNKAVYLAQLCLSSIPTLCKKYCMTNSPKSVICTPNIVEFNSEFLIYNTLAVPHIKFVAALLLIAETESCKKRLEMLYGNLSELYRMGFPSYNTSICQIAQGLMHYASLGSYTNPVFKFYSDLLSLAPEPMYGFFTIDPIYFPGLPGLPFSQWYCATKTGTLRRSVKDLIASDVDVSSEGGVSRALVMRMGDSRKWKSFLDRLRGNLDIQQEIEENAYLLFTNAKNVKDLYLKFLMIASSPSVATSMNAGNPFIQGLASSVYGINTHCYTRVHLTKHLGNLQKDVSKTCLIVELIDRVRELREPVNYTEEEIRVMYPSVDRYKELKQIILEARGYQLIKSHRFRQKRTLYEIIPTSYKAVITLKQAMRCIWFNESTDQSVQATNRALDYYKSSFPWIRNTIKETLEASPFTSYSELQGFIESHIVKNRRIRRIGPGSKSTNFKVKMLGLVRRSYLDGYILDRPGEVGKKTFNDPEYLSKLNLAMSLPTQEMRTRVVFGLLRDLDHPPCDISEFKNLGYRERKFAAIQNVVCGNGSSDEILQAMSESGTGIIYKYRAIQKRTENEKGEVSWGGKGSVTVTANGMVYMIEMMDQTCQSITVRSFDILMKYPKTLKQIMKELKLKPYEGFRQMEGRPCAKWTNDGISTTSYDGTPIFESKRLMKDIGLNSSIYVQARYKRLVLLQRDPSGNEDLVILAHVFRPEDIIVNPCYEITDSYEDAWMNQKIIESTVVLSSLRDFYQGNDISDQEFREWFADALLSRLYDTRRLNQSIRRVRMNVNEDDDGTEKVYEVLTQDEKEKLEQEMFDAFFSYGDFFLNIRSIAESPEINNENFVEQRSIGEVMMKDYEEDDYTINSKALTDFKRRMILFDAFIKAPEKDSTDFWGRIFNGIHVSSNSKLSEIMMKIYNLEKKEVTKSLDEHLMTKEEKLNSLNTVKTVIMPSRSVEVEEVYECETDEEDRELERMVKGIPDVFAQLDLIHEKAASSLKRSHPINLDKMFDMHGLKSREKIISGIRSLFMSNMENNINYLVKPSCSEPDRLMKVIGVKHNGDCFYESVIEGLRLKISVRELKNRLLSSKYYHICMADKLCSDSLNLMKNQASDKVIKLTCRELRVNICIHSSPDESKSEINYYNFKTDPSYQWLHLEHTGVIYQNCAMYEPLSQDFYFGHKKEEPELISDLRTRFDENPDIIECFDKSESLVQMEDLDRELSDFLVQLDIKKQDLDNEFKFMSANLKTRKVKGDYYRIRSEIVSISSKVTKELEDLAALMILFDVSEDEAQME